ncbi:uncharacterized protein LOC144334570 [Macaca mulatta]
MGTSPLLESRPLDSARRALPNNLGRPGVHTLLRPCRSEERGWRGDQGPRCRGPAVAREGPLARAGVLSPRAEGLCAADRYGMLEDIWGPQILLLLEMQLKVVQAAAVDPSGTYACLAYLHLSFLRVPILACMLQDLCFCADTSDSSPLQKEKGLR